MRVDKANKHHYPSIPESADDQVSIDRNLELLHTEECKPKPRREVLIELMARTFNYRREWILGETVERALSIVEKYPLLKKTIYVSHEIS